MAMKQPTIVFTVPVLQETFAVKVVEMQFINDLTTRAITMQGYQHVEWRIDNTKNPDCTYNCSTTSYGGVKGVFKFQE